MLPPLLLLLLLPPLELVLVPFPLDDPPTEPELDVECAPLELLVLPLPELLPPGWVPLLLLPPGLVPPLLLLLPFPLEPFPPEELLFPEPESSPCGKFSADGVGLFPVPP